MYHRTRRTVYVVLLLVAICGAVLVNPFGNTTASKPQSQRQKPTSSASLPGQQPSTNQAQNSIWPSLEKQLVNARAPKGSALERLIRENQDFAELDPSEVNDTLRVPLFLRVIWRKAHPESRQLANDPTKGYPFVLKEVFEWMQSHPDLLPGAPEPPVAPSDEVRAPVIGTNLRISGSQTVPQSESDIRINFFDPTKVIAASNNIGGSGMQSQFYSTNSGATWGQTSLSLFSGDSFHSDPTVDWTSDGRAWSTTLGINGAGTQLRGRSYVSTNNGAAWTQDGTFSGSQTSVDKQMVWIDHSSSSSFQNNQYVIWHNGAPVFMNRRVSAWGTPIQVSGSETTGTGIGSDVKTNAFGDVFGFWPDTGSKGLYVVKSTNGGTSYSTPIQVATTFDSYDIGVPGFNSRRVLIYVSGGAYRTAVKNNVYLTWSDLDAAGSEPGSNASSARKTRIWFSRSTNGGTSWSAKAMINNQAGLNDQFNQWMAVDETSGAIGVIYYDTVGDSTRKTVNIWYQASYDDGVTWEVPVKVTTAVTDETAGSADSGNQFGDYNGLSGFSGVFFPSWTDRRNNAREEIWTSKITDNAVPSPSVIAAGSSITNGNCGSPATTAIDPGETVTVAFSLQNVGSANTGANTTATLRATGGVTLPSAAQNYGQLTSGGGAVSRSFTFTASGNCGDTITATFDVTDGTYTTTVTYQFVLGGGALNTIFSQNFDGVTAPALPSGWTTSVLTGSVAGWATTTTNPDTAANTTFTNGITTTASNALISPSIALPAGSTGVTLSFRHAWNFESSWDGGVLEISTNSGSTWTDAVTLGATFSAGGYSATLNSSPNPLSGRQAWNGSQSGFVTTTATLPASLNGQSIQLRWRGGWDDSTANTNPNWRVDTVSISTPSCSSCSSCPTINGTVSGTATICSGSSTNVTVTVSGGTGPYSVTLSNGGGTQTGAGPTFTFPVSPTSTTTYTVSGTDSNTCSITGVGSAVITVNQPPAGANAGPDQTICTGGTTLAASQTTGTGVWSIVTGPNTSTAQFSSTTAANATFTPTTTGTYTLQWTVSNAPCAGTSTDQVVITVNAGPPAANAGGDQTFCFPATATLAANNPSPGTGAWTVVTGPNTSTAQFSNTASATSTFTPTLAGTYTLRWTITQSPCPATNDTVVLTYNAPPSTANAGPDQSTCVSGTVTLAANNPGVGVGTWSVASGPSTSTAQFSNVNAFNATFTPAGGAGLYTLQWTIANAPCAASSDQVVIDVAASCGSGSATLYVADTTNNRVQKFNGTTWTVVGTGVAGTGNGQFRTPEAVTASLDGVRIYVADTGNNRIQWSTNSGATWANFATSGTGLNQVSGPRGLALDSAGNLYVADGGNNRVLRFNGGTPGTGVLLAASGTAMGRVRTPNGLAIDSNFNLFIADTLNNRILKVTNANTKTTANTGTVLAGLSSGLTGVRAPQGLAVDSANNLYVADTGNNRVIRFAGGTSGTATALCLSGTTLGKVRAPEGVTISVFTAGALTGGEFLVVSDTTNNRIQGKLLSGATWTLVGTPNGLGSGLGQFRAPSKIR